MIIQKIIRKLKREFRKSQDYFIGRHLIKKSAYSSPDFLIIGSAKSGTTSLFQYLAQHPDIIAPKEKELKYFSMSQQEHGIKKYLENFPEKSEKGNKLTFEATPTYIYIKDSPKLISRLYPQMKYILILRDPIERAFSHWNFYKNSTFVSSKPGLFDSRTFSEAVRDELFYPEKVPEVHRYLKRGLYADQLQNWYRFVDPGNILILDFTDLKERPKDVLKQITSFLNLPFTFEDFSFKKKRINKLVSTVEKSNENDLKVFNVSDYSTKVDVADEDILKEYFFNSNIKLRELTGQKFEWLN